VKSEILWDKFHLIELLIVLPWERASGLILFSHAFSEIRGRCR
jgi:hypothetical protein